MNKLTIILLTLLIAGVAFAEKVPDVDEARPILDSRAVFSGTLDANSETWNRFFGGSVSLECMSEVIDSSTDGQYYEVFCIMTTDMEPIEVVVDPDGTTIGDTVMALFCDPFNVDDPMTNVVSYDDDGGEGLLSAFLPADGITLTPGDTYWLLLSTFGAGAMGDFVITTSDNVTDCVVAADGKSWSSLKGLYR